MLQSSNLSKMSPNGVVGLSSAMADGFYPNASLPGHIASIDNLVRLGQSNGQRDRSLLVDTLYTTGNDNDDFDVHVHAVELVGGALGTTEQTGIRTRKLGTLAVVAAAGVAKDGTFVPDEFGGNTVRVIDTITSWTPTDFGTAMLTAVGGPMTAGVNSATPVLLSPADDANRASVWFPDLGGSFGVFFEPAGLGRLLRGWVRRYT